MRKVADLTPHLGNITAPVLAIAGKQDSLVPYTQSELIANYTPNGIFKILDKMDHATFLEQPDWIKACMIEWLEADW